MSHFCSCNEEKKGVFRLLFRESTFEDYQKIRVQEAPEDLKGGEQPRSIDVNLNNDIAGIAWPGMHVVVTGILRTIQRIEKDAKSVYFDQYIDANSIELDNTDYGEVVIDTKDEEEIKKIRDKGDVLGQFIRSMAPSIYGYEDIKGALCLQLFSGSEIILPDKTHLRSDFHILLVGDPSIAKSQLLRYAVNMAPRGQYANAKMSTGVGLTASVVKSDFGGEHWEVQAGPMVLADKGICALDEIEKMNKDYRADLLEAMEQQSVHLAKAGKMATLMCRTSISAAANPVEGRFDPYEDLAKQINMEPYFISRFGLVFLMRDKPDEKRDNEIADHIMKVRNAGLILQRKKYSIYGQLEAKLEAEAQKLLEGKTAEINPDLVKKYVAYAKRKFFPYAEEDVRDHIRSFYVKARKPKKADGPISITARQLEDTCRLAEAHARMRLSNKVIVEDADVAIHYMTSSFAVIAQDPETGEQDIDIFYSGVGKTAREKFKDVKQILTELSGEDKSVSLNRIYERADEYHIERASLEKSIKKLKEIGEIFESKEGYLSLS